jgi:hypothetical protein
MPGGFFPHSGSSTPTNSVWFGAIVDRLNCLSAWDGSSSFAGGNNPQPTGGSQSSPILPLNFANQWGGLTNVSFTSFTTAPDGTTSTAQLMTENAAATVPHNITSCISVQHVAGGQINLVPTGTWRLSGYWKSTNRRIVYEVRIRGEGPPDAGIYVVFDLVNGAIGVAPTLLSASLAMPQFVAAAQIYPAPDGFYRCELDFSYSFGTSFYTETMWGMRVFLDNGVGSAPVAANYSYTGDGVSGAWGWKTNLMAVAAYSISNITFQDDFTSLNTIDLNNTKAPGFNFYTDMAFSNWFGNASPPPSLWKSGVSIVGGTILNVVCPPIPSLASFSLMPSLVSWTDSGFPAGQSVGQGWHMPFLHEVRSAVALNTTNISNGFTSWALGIDAFIDMASNSNNNVGYPYGNMEFDYAEIIIDGFGNVLNGGVPTFNCHCYGTGGTINNGQKGNIGCFTSSSGSNPQSVNGSTFQSINGTSTYLSAQSYPFDGFLDVSVGGTRYRQVGPVVPPATPPPNPTYWAVSTYGTGGSGAPPIPALDMGQFNTWSTLVLPSHGAPGPPGTQQVGMVLRFCNGALVGANTGWNSGGALTTAAAGNASCISSEASGFMIIQSFSAEVANPGAQCQYDFIRIMR